MRIYIFEYVIENVRRRKDNLRKKSDITSIYYLINCIFLNNNLNYAL